MTTRTLAANAAPLPLDTPDRRTMLASAGAAAVLAAIGTPATALAADADAPLMALRDPYESTLALMEHCAKLHSRAESAYFALQIASPEGDDRAFRKQTGLTIAERDYDCAAHANGTVLHRIARTPASTLAGVVFKAEVSRREGDADPRLLTSIVTDLLAIGSTCPAVRS